MTINPGLNSNSTREQESLLHQIKLFSDLTDKEFNALEKGTEIWFNEGDKILAEGENDTFFVVLEGKVEVILRDGAKEAVLSDYDAGDHFGELPIILGWSDHKCAAFAAKKTRLLKWDKDAFWRMVYSSPSLTRQILNSMARLLQTVETVLQQNQKLIALGGLAAGLAHELNNPAAAVTRSVTLLSESIDEWKSIVQRLNLEKRISPTVWKHISKLLENALDSKQSSNLRDGRRKINGSIKNINSKDQLLQSEVEEQIIDWLESNNISDAWKIASELAVAGIRIADLNNLVDALASSQEPVDDVNSSDFDSKQTLNDILRWITSTVNLYNLLKEIKGSTVRISELVSAVKSYSYMDQAPLQDIDVHEGLESTLTILQYKIRKSNITIVRDYDPNLSHINAHGNEINQAWTNFIDNAIDAIGEYGTITIRTRNAAPDHIIVEIIDDGKTGIPESIRARIFEPFFTTKEPGKGTGLGLSISHRIITQTHKGDISVYSKAGETRFVVRLPVFHDEHIQQKYWSWIKQDDDNIQ
jgi:signal transduction histidine kinase